MLSARRARVFLLSPPSRLGSVILSFLFAIWNIHFALSALFLFVFLGITKDNIDCRSAFFSYPRELYPYRLVLF